MHFEAEMYHAAAKSFVCAQLATVREHSPAITRVQLNLPAVRREVAPQGTFSYPDGQFTLPHPMVKSNIGYNSRMLRNKRKKIPQRKLCGIYYAISASVLRDLTPRERTDPAGASGERNAW